MQSNVKLSQKDAAKIKRALQTRRQCLLCGHPAVYAALFWPAQPELWGGTLGKARVLAYGLCRPCKGLPAVTQHVEARIQDCLVGQRN